jgi:hypothetical protein
MNDLEEHWLDGAKEAAKWPLVVGVVLIFFGLSLLFALDPQKTIWKVILAGVAELGFAFAIAWIILAAIEVKSRNRHEKEMDQRRGQFEDEIREREKTLNKNIFDYIYSVKLPKSLFLCVEKHIFQSPFIKEHQRLEYTFGERKDGWILIRGEFEYEVKNVSQDTQTYPVQFFIGKEVGRSQAPFDEEGYYKVSIGGKEYTVDEIKAADEAAEDTEEFQRFESKHELKPDESVEVRLGFYLRKRSTDSELWQTIDLCDSLDARVRYDPKEFDLHITPVHSCDEFSSKPDRDDFGVRVQLSEPLLKGNGVQFWWAPMDGDDVKLLSSNSSASELLEPD